MAHRYGAPKCLVTNPFRTDRVLAALDAPVLVMTGTHDELFPPQQGRQLAKVAHQATYVEFEAGHNDFPGLGNAQRYWDTIGGFLHTTGSLP